jgi:hypothetical protein
MEIMKLIQLAKKCLMSSHLTIRNPLKFGKIAPSN